MQGGILIVENNDNIFLTGPSKLIYEGKIIL